MISLKQLQTVRAVAEEGSLTRAARRLYVTQPALSHQLSLLERQLGVAVFHRVGKRLVPAPAGVRLLRAAEAVLAQIGELERDLRLYVQGGAGRLRVTTQCYTSYHWLPEILPEFQRRHGGIEFRIVPEAALRAEEAVVSGEVDVALVYDVTDREHLLLIPLFDDEQVLIVPPGHELATQAFVRAEDFARLDLLMYYNRPAESLLFNRVLVPSGVTPASITEVRLTEAIVALVAAGAGVSVLTRWSVAPQLREGRIVAVPVTEAGLKRRWHAAVLRQAELSAYIRDFIALLQRGPDRLFDGRAGHRDRAFAGITPAMAAPPLQSQAKRASGAL
jgi:LysR family transcriptional regulator for metE and metH